MSADRLALDAHETWKRAKSEGVDRAEIDRAIHDVFSAVDRRDVLRTRFKMWKQNTYVWTGGATTLSVILETLRTLWISTTHVHVPRIARVKRSGMSVDEVKSLVGNRSAVIADVVEHELIYPGADALPGVCWEVKDDAICATSAAAFPTHRDAALDFQRRHPGTVWVSYGPDAHLRTSHAVALHPGMSMDLIVQRLGALRRGDDVESHMRSVRDYASNGAFTHEFLDALRSGSFDVQTTHPAERLSSVLPTTRLTFVYPVAQRLGPNVRVTDLETCF